MLYLYSPVLFTVSTHLLTELDILERINGDGQKNELNHIKKIKIYVKTKPNKQNLLKICKVCFHCWVMACYCNHQELPCDLLSPSVRQAPFWHSLWPYRTYILSIRSYSFILSWLSTARRFFLKCPLFFLYLPTELLLSLNIQQDDLFCEGLWLHQAESF